MRLSVLMGSVSQGLLWSILAIGVYITYKILDYADLTTEGSYPLGAAVAAQMILSGANPFVATFVSMFAGMAAGFVTGFLNTKLKIPSLLAGILSMTGLYCKFKNNGKSQSSAFKTGYSYINSFQNGF